MRRIALGLLTLAAAGLAAGCMAIAYGLVFTYYYIWWWWDRHVSEAAPVSVELTPARMTAGGSALLEFTLPPELAGGDGAAQLLELHCALATALPLLPEVYAPGAVLPTPEAARAALMARYPEFDSGCGAAGAWPARDCIGADGRLPVLLVAPDVGCEPQVLLYLQPRGASAVNGGLGGGPAGPGGSGGNEDGGSGGGGAGMPEPPGGAPAANDDAPGTGPAPRSPAGWPALCKVVLQPEG